MLLPQNHEKIQTISEIFKEDMDRHEMNGGAYHDEKAGELAARAIQSLMPELADMRQTRIAIEANTGMVIEGSRSKAYNGVYVQATLERVAIQSMVTKFPADASGFSDQLNQYDLFAVFKPRYTDPNPQDLVFGQEILVPFSDITRFESAA